MLILLNGVIAKISAEYAERYATSATEVLSAHIVKEIGLMSKAARSSAVVEWLADENNDGKKSSAFEEMAGIVGELYSFNLYVGLESSRNEYKIETNDATESIQPFAILNENNPDDAWFFSCINSDESHMTNIGIDLVMQRKRMWLNYKVVQDGVPLGVICTGLEFSHVVGELFSSYDSSAMRGLIVDKNGVIHMDSALSDERAYLYGDFEVRIEDEFSNTEILNTVELYLNNINGYSETIGKPTAVRMSSGPYRYVTIAPIKSTNWVVVLLSNGASLFDVSNFIPILATVLILLIAIAVATGVIHYRLIFKPLGRLDRSLASLRDNIEVNVYGTERTDELGELSKTILELFNKANVDALTGIYNRRYLESNLDQIMAMLSRDNGLLSVLMLDIDFFKRYNDAYGHDQGDVCLRAVAHAIDGGIARASDFTARYGGEEFIVILPNTNEAGAQVIANKLLNSVRALGIPHSGNDAAPFVTVSIGVTTGQVAYGQSWEKFVKRADEALYTSKQSGRNKYTFLPVPEFEIGEGTNAV